jgi:hypothetical protein
MTEEEIRKELRKKFYTIRDLITGWPAIFTCKKTKKRTRVSTYFVSKVDSVRQIGKNILVTSSSPIYASRGWEDDIKPRVHLIRLKANEIRIELSGFDLDSIILPEDIEQEIKDYIMKKVDEVLKCVAFDGDDEEDDIDKF